jgi:hypothetical protein
MHHILKSNFAFSIAPVLLKALLDACYVILDLLGVYKDSFFAGFLDEILALARNDR